VGVAPVVIAITWNANVDENENAATLPSDDS
jgi:hypothetical protein